MKPNTVLLYFAPLHSEKGAEERLLRRIPKERREELARCVNPSKRKLFLYGEILLRDAVCGELGISNKTVEFSRTEQGKPYLKDGRIQFNISHTECALAAAVAEEEVGVDIEKIRPAPLSVAEKFTKEELNAVREAEDPNRKFFELWTRKEALCKAKGISLRLRGEGLSPDMEIRTYEREGYLLSLCCRKGAKVYFAEVSESDFARCWLSERD